MLSPPPSLVVPLDLDSCRALAAYDDTARRLLTSLKNGQQRWVLPDLARRMVALVPAEPHLLVTWAPTSPERRRRRGFDQAELLARAVARRAGLPVASLLRRRPGPPQAGRSRGERRAPAGFDPTAEVPRPVLVVDDIATTGATLTAAASALRAAGAPAVHGLVVARAPHRYRE
ncbi:MAG: ComF family protein [Acidimicrobiales bacterium]